MPTKPNTATKMTLRKHLLSSLHRVDPAIDVFIGAAGSGIAARRSGRPRISAAVCSFSTHVAPSQRPSSCMWALTLAFSSRCSLTYSSRARCSFSRRRSSSIARIAWARCGRQKRERPRRLFFSQKRGARGADCANMCNVRRQTRSKPSTARIPVGCIERRPSSSLRLRRHSAQAPRRASPTNEVAASTVVSSWPRTLSPVTPP